MKQIIKFSLAILMMALCSIPVNAQNSQPQSNQHQRMSREQLAKAQANYIARQHLLRLRERVLGTRATCEAEPEEWQHRCAGAASHHRPL